MTKPSPTHCPWCAEPIEPGVLKCRSCGEFIDKKAELAPVKLGSGDPYDPTDAIKWPFDDPAWLTKTLLGAACLLGGALLIIPMFLLMGYQVRIARQQKDAPGSRPMPEWDDLGGLLKDGFFYFVAQMLPLLLIIMVMVVALGVVIAIDVGASGGKPGPLLFVGIIGFYGAIFFVSIGFQYLLPAIMAEYIETGSVAAAFRFGSIWRRITTTDYLMLFLVCFCVNMLGSMGVVACYIGMFFTIPLGLYVQAGLVGRYLHREHAREHGLLP